MWLKAIGFFLLTFVFLASVLKSLNTKTQIFWTSNEHSQHSTTIFAFSFFMNNFYFILFNDNDYNDNSNDRNHPNNNHNLNINSLIIVLILSTIIIFLNLILVIILIILISILIVKVLIMIEIFVHNRVPFYTLKTVSFN